MYPRCSPGWVVSDHPKDQLPNLLRRRSSSNLRPNSGDQPPVDTKTSPVPADDSFGRNDEKGLLPSRPDPPSYYPEELIEEAQARARMFETKAKVVYCDPRFGMGLAFTDVTPDQRSLLEAWLAEIVSQLRSVS
jgi:hypothetical protein